MAKPPVDPIKKAGVLGWPVAHSLSPVLHRHWLSHYGIDGNYEARPVAPEDLQASLMTLRAEGFCGVNLTVPHKEAALPFMDSLDEAAQAIGAVNTVIASENGLHGMNTDSYGFRAGLAGHNAAYHGQKAVVLGAGGAARAVIHALKQAGFTRIIIANRTEEHAQTLARHFAVDHAPWGRREAILDGADLLVNTTVLGMTGFPALALNLDLLPTRAVVCDIVYAPLETALLSRARARGNPTIDGLSMLMHQAVPAFEAWFGVRPEVSDHLRNMLVEKLS